MSRAPAAAEVPFFDRARETAPLETLRGWQWERLASGLGDVLGSNAFWRARLHAAGVRDPRDLASWADFAKLPRLTKAELAADQAAAPPFGANRTYPLDRYVRVFQTSGTTGPPIRWLETDASWTWWAHCWAMVFRAAGLGPGDRLFFPFSFGLFVGFWAGLEGARVIGAMAVPGRGQDSPTRLHAIRELGATALVCTPSYGLHLAEVGGMQGLDPAGLGVRTTVHAGEPGAGIPAVRARLETLWGARAYDHAGMTEVGAYGFECAAQAGLHVNEARVRGRGAGSGERPAGGARRARRADAHELRPLGRARPPLSVGRPGAARHDSVRVRPHVRPPRGRHPRPRRRHAGRPRRQRFPSALEGIVRRFPVVDEFQIEVFRRGVLDEVRLLLEIDDGTRPAGSVRETLTGVAEAIRRDLGIRIEVSAVPARTLPRYELKARRVVRRETPGG